MFLGRLGFMNINIQKFIRNGAYCILAAFIILFSGGKVFASNNSAFHISQFKNGIFQEVYNPSFQTKFSTKTFDFTNLSDLLTLKINESGDLPYSGMDSAILNACGTKLTPSSAYYTEDNQSVLEDILRLDLNVVVTHDKPIQISWNLPAGCSTATLSMNANEYGEALPMKGKSKYTLGSNSGNLLIDGKITETDGTKPIYNPFWEPTTGHPNGFTYLYAKDDANYLYFAADITADNTDDVGPDWIAITIGDKKFKVTDTDNTYGKCAFGLTSKVAYKHQTCELKIPKSLSTVNPVVSFTLEYYGTAGVFVSGLGDGVTDYSIGAGATDTLTVQMSGGSPLSVTSRTAIEMALNNGKDQQGNVLHYEWVLSGNNDTTATLTITGDPSTTTTFADDVSIESLTESGGVDRPGPYKLVDSSPFAGGDGLSASTAYQITTCQQLQDMNTNLSANYILNNNIDCSATNIWNEDPANLGTYFGFKPVGDWNIPFVGNLDGNNKKITGLYIDRPEESYVGLFGGIGLLTSSVEVKDLTLKDFNITGSGDVGALTGSAYSQENSNSFKVSNVHVTGESIVTGGYSVGGIVGFSNYLEMDSSSVAGTINVSGGSGGGLVGGISNEGKAGLHIATSNSTANVVGVAGVNYVGGLVGTVGCSGDWICKIETSYSSGNVNGGSYVGGLVGYNNATITKTYASGNVTGVDYVGGLIGGSNNSTYDSYALGNVMGSSAVGGLIGNQEEGECDIQNTYSKGHVDGINDVGGLLGYDNEGCNISSSYYDETTAGVINNGVGGDPKTTTEMKTQSTFEGWNFTLPDGIWGIDTSGTKNNGYPYFQWQIFDETGPTFEELSAGDTRVINITEGQTITTNPYTIYVKPTDGAGITKVEFYIDNVLICTDTTADVNGYYSCQWDTSKYHSDVKVIAYDGLGNSTTLTRSTTVSLTGVPNTGLQPASFLPAGIVVIAGIGLMIIARRRIS